VLGRGSSKQLTNSPGRRRALLEAEGYGWGDLEPVPAPTSDAERRGDKGA